MELSLPTIQEINFLNNNSKDLNKGLLWIENYHKIMNPLKNKKSNGWHVPRADEGLLIIKKSLLFLNKYYTRYYNNDYKMPKREYLLRQIKNKISTIHNESNHRYYNLKNLYIREKENNKELERRISLIQEKYLITKNELHMLRMKFNKERKNN